ncbi:MAG: hypothetical protein QME63_07815 [Actinomycetota bacterium]|nr:hypothetical protein [Actinomycetota bacterium]
MSQAEINWMLIEPLKAGYGNAVNINYFDVKDENFDASVRELIERYHLPLPLTLLNGEAVSAGYVSFHDLALRIDKLLGKVKE